MALDRQPGGIEITRITRSTSRKQSSVESCSISDNFDENKSGVMATNADVLAVIKGIQSDIKKLENKVSNLTDKVDKRLDQLCVKITKITDQISEVDTRVSAIQNKVETVESRVTKLERNTVVDTKNSNIVVVKGLKKSDDDKAAVNEIFTSIGIEVNIISATRTVYGKDPKPIIVTLEKPEDCRSVLENKAQLKENPDYARVFIEPDRPKHVRVQNNIMRLVAKHSEHLEFRNGRLIEKKSE